ncbi:MAG TPA: hypothetical protein VFV52_07220 [Bacilli bacterium]|nr:hypothetical protein [Bacilli bacterium]
MRLHFRDLKIDSISTTSGIFVGDNRQVSWKNEGKSNEGFGTLSGDESEQRDSVSVVADNDKLDFVTVKPKPTENRST